MEAKGERFDVASLVPRPVPDEQNFAMTPLLRPLLNYTITNGTTVWHDEGGLRRAEAVDASIPMQLPPGSMLESDSAGQNPPVAANTRPPKYARWSSSERTDLRAWRAFYGGNTNCPAPAQPRTPAADVLVALSKFDAELTELRAAAKRPDSVFPIHYEEAVEMQLKHLAVLRRVSVLATLRASALLELGRADEALRDVELTLRFGDALKDEPTLISQLVHLAITQVALQPVWEGLADGRWNEAQLASLQSRLDKLQPLAGYPLAIRGENTLFLGQTIDRLRTAQYNLADLGSGSGAKPAGMPYVLTRAIPDGWFYQNQLVCSRLLLEHFLPMVDLERQRVDPAVVKAGTETLGRLVARRSPYNLIARMLLPAVGRVVERFAYTQATVELATVACALERHRLAHGQYPESVDALVPQFVEKLPHGIIGGRPLIYRRTDDGQFALYSVGWNESDDGGEVALKKDGSPDYTNGDWVWRYPAK
jgi:hypothetical protein